MLAATVRDAGHPEEALAWLDRAAALPGGDPVAVWAKFAVYWQAGRLDEAEAAIERSLAIRRGPSATLRQVVLLMLLHGNLEQADAVLKTVPGPFLLKAEGIYASYLLGRWQRDANRCLHALELTGDDLIQGSNYLPSPNSAVPTGLWRGDAYAMANNPAAAEKSWRDALAMVARRAVEQPNESAWTFWQANVEARLGERVEALRHLRLFQQLRGNRNPYWDRMEVDALLVRLDERDEALASLAALLDELPTPRHREMQRTMLRLDPVYDGLRADPRFQALLVDAKKETVTAPPPDQKSVAVLAFQNLSDDKDNEYFSDGISEELLNVLAKVPGLKVSARTSAFYFKGKQVQLPEIAKQLGVAYVVEGSVRKSGSKVRITAQLIKAADGFHVWSDNFDRELKDIFAVQDEIAGLIAQNLQLTLGTAMRKTRTVDPEAYRLLLEGRYFFNRRDNEGFTRAEAAFTAALKIDPELAEAHAGLAGVYVVRANFRGMEGLPGFDDTAPDLRRAGLAAQRAIELDPTHAEAYSALGFTLMLESRLAESEQQHLKAIALSPNSATAHAFLAALLDQRGRLDRAIDENDKISQLDPLFFINLVFYAQGLAQLHRYDEAWKVAERAASLRTDAYVPLRGEQARILLGLGRNAEAAEAARDVLRRPELMPRFRADSLALWVLRQTGFAAEAQGHATALLERFPENSFQRGFLLASVGRFDDALPYLEHARGTVVGSLMADELWDPYRADPRFEQLMAKLGRAAEYKVARETLARIQKEQAAKK